MNKLSVLIVEDEVMVAESLKKMMQSFSFDIENISSVNNVTDAIKYIHTHKPNLVLFDVKIIGGTSFDILKELDFPQFKIIFITAHQDFAVKAFKYSAIDYLLKPINTVELEDALRRALTEITKDYTIKLQALNYNLKQSNSRIILNTLDELFIVDTKDIIALKSDGCYTHFYLDNKNDIMISKPIKFYDDLLCLDNPSFFRVHKSYIINISKINKVNKKEGAFAVMTNEMSIPIADSRWKSFMSRLSL